MDAIIIGFILIVIWYILRDIHRTINGHVYCKPRAGYYIARMNEHIKHQLGKR